MGRLNDLSGARVRGGARACGPNVGNEFPDLLAPSGSRRRFSARDHSSDCALLSNARLNSPTALTFARSLNCPGSSRWQATADGRRTKPLHKDFPGVKQAVGCSPLVSGCLVLAPDRITRSAPCGRRRCGATENRLHIYRRPCCASWRGPRYEPLSRAPFAVRGWARLPPRTVYRVRQLPV